MALPQFSRPRPRLPRVELPAMSRTNHRSSPGAVVIGGDYQGLGIVQSLGRHGIPTCIVDDEYSIARYSNYATFSIKLADLRDEAITIKRLLDLGRRWSLQGWVLFPTRDETVAAISRHRDELADVFRVPTAPWESVKWVWDKRKTYSLASELGIPIPRTWYAADARELKSLHIQFPAAIKPAIKEHFIYATKAKAWRANNLAELETLFCRAARLIGPEEVMIQEVIPGSGAQQFAYCTFYTRGGSVGSMVVRRARQHPREFGRASTYVETTEQTLLETLSQRFLGAINYYGLSELEYKLDPRDGRYKLLDVNARTWGYHTLGRTAGVDFPYLLFQDQLGQPVDKQRGRPGVAWIRMTTDLPTALTEIAAGRLNWKDYWKSVRSAHVEAVFSREDPLPGLAELALLPYLWLRRGF